MLLAFEMNLRGGGVDFGAVVEVGVPVAAALRREVHEVPDGSEQVDAALADVGGHPRMRGVEVAEGAVGVTFSVRTTEVPCSEMGPFRLQLQKAVLAPLLGASVR